MKADRASATARLIAAATVMRDLQGVLGAPRGAAAWCERFLSTNRRDRLLLASVRSRLGRGAWRLAECVTIPGLVAHWMRRKREIDRLVKQAAAEGFDQLIVIGAGLDSLAFRVADKGHYQSIISADHPATLAVVRSAIEGSPPSRVELLPLDLSQPAAVERLADAQSFDPRRPTLIVIEGVLMYLSESAVKRTLGSLATLPAPAARQIASSMIAEPGEAVGFQGQARLVAAWLRRRSETMYWASTREALPGVFGSLGWSDVAVIDLAAEEAVGSPGTRGLNSEVLVVADCQLNS